MVGSDREVLPRSPTLLRGNLRLGGDVPFCHLFDHRIPLVNLIGNTSTAFRGATEIFTELHNALLWHPTGAAFDLSQSDQRRAKAAAPVSGRKQDLKH